MNNEIKINIKIFYYIIKNENDKVKDRTPDSCENGVLLQLHHLNKLVARE